MRARTLSANEASAVLSLEAARQEVVTLAEVRALVGVTPGYARKLVHDLAKKGWLQSIRRGVYLLNPADHGPDALPDRDPWRIGSLLADPYYFAYATAAELHGLLPQAGSVYYLATSRRSELRPFGPSQFRLVHQPPSRFFGTTVLRRRSRDIVVSDLERTIVDAVERPELSGGMAGIAHILGVAKPSLRWAALGRYLDRVPSRSLRQRIGYLAEVIRPSVPPPASWARRARPPVHAPYVPLGPPSVYGRRGPHEPRWRIIRNVADSDLFAEGRIP